VIGRGARALVARLLRVTTYVSFLTLGAGLVAARTAHAKVEDGAFALGEQLLQLPAAGEGVHELAINGQRVLVATAQTTQPLAAVLDRFERECDEHADGLLDDLRELPAALERAPRAVGSPGLGVLRDTRGGRGVVACFATGRPTDHAELAARLDRFAKTLDLATLGDLRYVAARTLEGGATQVVATWTTGPVLLSAMFPEHGDAAGDDPRAAPRPVGTRVLSAHDRAAPYGVFLYASRGTPAEALAGYRAALVAARFVELPAVAARAPEALAFERPGLDVLVSAEAQPDGGAILSVLELPANTGRRAP
jgi:hypothetical protein